MIILVINAGSSSIKYQLYDMPDKTILEKGLVECIGQEESRLVRKTSDGPIELNTPIADHQAGMDLIAQALVSGEKPVLSDISEIEAVGHRVVHGSEEFTGSVAITDEVIESIEKFADLAPLHNPPNLTGIRAAIHKLPDAVQVACFDTAFHTSIPRTAYLYALPYEIYEKYRVRRYGFHGTSHRFVARQAAQMLGKPQDQVNVITCHLGNGCSIAAVQNGKSVDTSMGLTPLEGLVMGTRTGDFDPAILFYLARKGYSIEDLDRMCNKQSGLLGISGESNDMRNLDQLAGEGHERAKLAIDIFTYRVRKYIGTYTSVLGRLDAIVFTGGIGENNEKIREAVCSRQSQIGIEIDPKANASFAGENLDISSPVSRVKVLVIPTDEEVIIADDTYRIAQE